MQKNASLNFCTPEIKNAARSPYAAMAENDRRKTTEMLCRILQSEGVPLVTELN